jgi:DNA-binding GntR family transcriptional regulator
MVTTMQSQNVKTKKDTIVEELREAILSGELEPGERLRQDKLAARYRVSSTPIREALRELEAEGVLDHMPRRGVRVADVNQTTLRDMREIYLIRGALEALATRMGVSYLNTAHVQRMKALLHDMESETESGQLKNLRKLNYEFHMLIYRAADMPQLLKPIRVLWTKFPWDTLHVVPGRAADSVEEHRRIIKAIEDGNARLAGRLMQEHIDHGAAALTEYLQKTNLDFGHW